MKKRVLSFLLALGIMAAGLLPMACRAAGDPRLLDEAGLLTEKQQGKLQKKLDKLSNKLEFDITVATVDSLGDKTATQYADDLYDSLDWGWGEDRDGILLLVCPEERDYAISTCGAGIDAFRLGAREAFEVPFLKKMGKDNYYKAFLIYADQAEKFYGQAQKGKPYDGDFLPPKMGYVALITGILGTLGSLIIVKKQKDSLKSVKAQPGAAAYRGDLRVTRREDHFLRSYETSYTEESTSSRSSSGGDSSGSHESSSGTTHGGWSGKY